MRLAPFCWLLLLALATPFPALGATDKIIKVLPQYLDAQGRNSISPSLYDRDAYQARLRRHPEDCSGMAFQIQWKAKTSSELTLKLEVRGAKNGQSTAARLETPVQHLRGLNKWTPLLLKGSPYDALGEVTAWRVSLWDGEKLLAEQKSFLW